MSGAVSRVFLASTPPSLRHRFEHRRQPANRHKAKVRCSTPGECTMGGIARYSFSAAYAGDDCKAIWRCQQMIFLPRFFSVLAILPLIVVAAPAALQKDMPYVAARKLLLKEGWLPVNLHLHDDYALMGVERELFKHNFKEFDSCSIDYSSCVMRYKRANNASLCKPSERKSAT